MTIIKEKEFDSNDVIIGKTCTMLIFAFIARYGDSTSKAELGARLRKSYNSYQQYVEANRETWQQEGAKIKETRKIMGITQSAVSELIGVHPHTLGKFEKGEPVRCRTMMKQSYQTTINFIDAQRRLSLRQLNTTAKPE